MNHIRLTLLLTASSWFFAAPAVGGVLPAGSQTVHRYFGALQSVKGTIVALRLRDGRLLVVDAAKAFANNRVSQPLFFGKATVVQGVISTDGRFHATSVNRAAPRSSSWGVDR